jgi:asparagine synthase (glutamine-hydrolysing)
MCGIAGIFRSDKGSVDASLLARMTDSLAHRGPDERGLFNAPGIGLGHRRLSIIDVSDGQQPLYNEDRSVVVVFNGEIYNFQELREELLQHGHTFRTHSDTEVIVHGWEQWGRACVERFRGMFAFALWDNNRQQLFLARDRLGIKPLYYGRLQNGDMVFASELKALKQHPRFATELDPQAVEEYFGYGYIPEPRSIYRNIFKLPPGHTLLLEGGDGRLPPPQAFWDVSYAQQPEIGDAAAIDAFLQGMDEAVRVRLIAEVPLGAFLSGGVDSSSVVASMAGGGGEPVNTFSIAFGDAEYDESSYAAQVAQLFSTRHTSERVDPDDYSLLDRLAALYDEPFADSSALPTYRVCELAKKHVTVVLSGDGGDELLAGYRRYGLHTQDLLLKARLPGVVRSLLGGVGRIWPDNALMPPALARRQALLSMAQDPVTAYFEINAVIKNDLRARLYSRAFKQELDGYSAVEVMRRHAEAFDGNDPLSLAQYLDIKTYLPGDILTKVDRASMAHALEVRVPLIDHKLMEWAATLPRHFKQRNGEGKWLLKKSMEAKLPHDILYRSKRGFAVPLANWFRGPLKDRVEASLESELLQDTGIFDQRMLRDLWSRHLDGKGDYAQQIWSLLMFESFLRNDANGSIAAVAS